MDVPNNSDSPTIGAICPKSTLPIDMCELANFAIVALLTVRPASASTADRPSRTSSRPARSMAITSRMPKKEKKNALEKKKSKYHFPKESTKKLYNKIALNGHGLHGRPALEHKLEAGPFDGNHGKDA